MSQIILTGLNNRIEIPNISGKGITLKKISIPNENCSNFYIQYDVTNTLTGAIFSSPIHCIVSPYQRDVTQVKLNKSILIPADCTLGLQIISLSKLTFGGESIIEYESFQPKAAKPLVFISEKDRQNAYRVALVNLARFFSIPNWEFDNNQTLYDKLKLVANPIVDLLKKYFSAYDNWFDFYMEIKEKETDTSMMYELNEKEREKLSELIQKRQDTLNALQAKFDELQFDQFKRLQGFEDVDGIKL